MPGGGENGGWEGTQGRPQDGAPHPNPPPRRGEGIFCGGFSPAVGIFCGGLSPVEGEGILC